MLKAQDSLYRILDANLNRAKEGLRVCEEVARFVLEDPPLTRQCRSLRYGLDRAAVHLPGSKLLQARDSKMDVGRPEKRGPVRKHQQTRDLLTANLRRVQESLRVLEEFSRLVHPASSKGFGALRFKVYSLEKLFDRKSAPLRHR